MSDRVAFLLFAATMSILAGALAFLLRKRPRASEAAAIVSVGLLAFKIVLSRMPSLETRLFPYTWYIYVSCWHLPAAMFLCFHLLNRSRNRARRIRALLLSVILGGVVLWSARFFLLPSGVHELRDTWDADGICLQSTEWSCAPAACATLLNEDGIETTEAEMARLALARPRYGTNVLGMYRALKMLAEPHGLRVEVLRGDLDMLRRLRKPCLILSRFDVDHVNVVYVVTDGGAIVAEPSWGLESWPTTEDISQIWSGTALALFRESPFEPPEAVFREQWRSAHISPEVKERIRASLRETFPPTTLPEGRR